VLSRSEHVVNGSGEFVRSGARDDNGISPAMGFLGNAKESAPIVLAEFHVEVLPLDLDLLRFDNIIHLGAECGRVPVVGEAKNSPNFYAGKDSYLLSATVTCGAGGAGDPGLVVNRRPQNQFVA
jgi:hypothetical protein